MRGLEIFEIMIFRKERERWDERYLWNGNKFEVRNNEPNDFINRSTRMTVSSDILYLFSISDVVSYTLVNLCV